MGVANALTLRRRMNLDITTSQELDAFLRKGGTPTWAGVPVTERQAFENSAFFDGVRIISEDIGKLPMPVYRRLSETNRERAPDSPWWRLIHDQAYNRMSAQQFRELLTAWALVRGNGFAWRVPINAPVTTQLVPLDPRRVRPERLNDSEIIYHVRMPPDGGEQDFTRRQVFHLPGIGFDGESGKGILTFARQTLSHSAALERHGATVFGNGANPGGHFRHPGTLSDTAHDRLRRELVERTGGDQSNSPLLLEEGMDWTQTGLSNEDSQFLESRQFMVVEIARWFRLPPHKLGDLSRATFSNIEHQSLEYVTDALLSWGVRWELAYKQQIIGLDDPHFAELLYDALLRADTKSRFEAYRIAGGRPWMAGNEIRRRENMNPSDDESMDEVILPKNLDAGMDEREGQGSGSGNGQGGSQQARRPPPDLTGLSDIEQMAALFLDGASYGQLAIHFGIEGADPAKTVQQRLRRHFDRSPSEAREEHMLASA